MQPSVSVPFRICLSVLPFCLHIKRNMWSFDVDAVAKLWLEVLLRVAHTKLSSHAPLCHILLCWRGVPCLTNTWIVMTVLFQRANFKQLPFYTEQNCSTEGCSLLRRSLFSRCVMSGFNSLSVFKKEQDIQDTLFLVSF